VSGAVVAFVPDLLDRSRVSAAAAAASRSIVVARTPEDLVDLATTGATLVVDLARPGVLEVLGRLGAVTTIGFASHVDAELIRAARAAGCTRVLARSAFFTGLAGLLAAPPEPGADR
jgi:hypothetical protein